MTEEQLEPRLIPITWDDMSPTIGKIAEALSKAQSQMPVVKRESENPFFKRRYASLAQITEAVRKPLSDNNLAYSHLVIPHPEYTVVKTILMHSSGEWLSSTICMRPVKNDPQGTGSALSYGKRYGLSGLVGVATQDEDDDAEGAVARPAHSTAQPQEGDLIKPEPATDKQKGMIFASARDKGISNDAMKDRMMKMFGVASTNDLTKAQASKLIKSLEGEKE